MRVAPGAMRRSWVALGLVLVVAACTGPVRSFPVYESKAGDTAEVVASAVETARLAVDAARDGKAYGRYLTQVLVEAEEDAGSAQGVSTGSSRLTGGPASSATGWTSCSPRRPGRWLSCGSPPAAGVSWPSCRPSA